MKENLANETKGIYKANDEMSKLIEELDEANAKLNLSRKLLKIDKLLAIIKQLNETEKYNEINGVLNNIQLLINDPDDKIIRRLNIYQKVKAKLTFERENLLTNLKKRFNSLVSMKEKSFHKTRSITISITKNNSKLMDCVNTLKESDYEFVDFLEFFMRNVFEPIICRAVSLEFTEKDNFTMSLSYSTESIPEELRPSYAVVFNNICQVLSYLNNMNVTLSSGDFFLVHVFQDRRKEFFDMIFNMCLIYSIPKTFEEKVQSTMDDDIKKMSQMFIDLNFFSAPTEKGMKEPQLEDYSQKIDELFRSNITKNIQASASELLKRDLHDMILITEDTTISTNTPLTFPRSMVSKSTLELIRLLEKIVNQARSCTDNIEKQNNLIMSIRTVLENYTFTVQLHHAKFMSQIPQQSALFYNNCMFLSNWIATNRETENCGIEQIVDDLEKQGWEILQCQIEKQKIQLVQILTGFGKFYSGFI